MAKKQKADTVEIDGKEYPARMGLRPLARAIGIAHTSLLKYETGGAVSRGADKKFDVREVLEHRAGIGEKRAETSEQTQSLSKSKAKKEYYLAEQARLKAEKAAGLLMERAIVENTLEAIGAEMVITMKNLVPKLKPHMSDDGRGILEKAIDAALRDFAKKLRDLAAEDHDAP